MARGNKKNISDETKQDVIHLRYNRHRKQVDIASDLRISLSSVKKILGSYRRDSQGLRVPTLRVRGRPRILQTADVDVSPSTQAFLRDPQFFQFVIGLVTRTPDIYLHEIQAELRELCGVDTCLSSIWTALRRRGYKRKRVSCQSSSLVYLDIVYSGVSGGHSTRRRSAHQLRDLHDDNLPCGAARVR
jgi:transposase